MQTDKCGMGIFFFSFLEPQKKTVDNENNDAQKNGGDCKKKKHQHTRKEWLKNSCHLYEYITLIGGK